MGAGISEIGDYTIDGDKVLGEGGFGKVYMGVHKKTNEKVAVKQCLLQSDDHGVMAMQEIKHFQNIPDHKHIVRMKDFNFAMKSFWIVMEFCDLGDLENYMMRYRPDITRQIKIMHQTASAVHHLHNLKEPILHRDIKPGNILFKRENGSDVAKLTDFGISKKTEIDAMNRTIAGTQLFMAPEMLSQQPYDFSVDTYALGLVYLAMIIFKPSDEHLIPLSETAIRSGKLIPLGVEMVQCQLSKTSQPIVIGDDPRDGAKAKAVKALIREMTSYTPSARTSTSDVLSKLQHIDGGRIEGDKSKSAIRRSLFTSNLPSQETVVGYTAAAASDDSSSGSSAGASTDSSSPDLGYQLLREMMEDQLREKRHEELRRESAREAAKEAAGLLPILALLHLIGTDDDPAQEFEPGDRVVFLKDIIRAKELQEGHGGWSKAMEKYLDEEGVVKERCNRNRDLRVQFPDGKCLVLNAQAVEKSDPSGGRRASNLAAASCKFKIMDCIKINVEESKLKRLQKGHGGYNRKMERSVGVKGIIHLILDNGDVYVEFFNGDKWSLNPEALELVDMKGVPIEAGDLVAIIDDKTKVMRLQENCGGWTTEMAPCLGRSGVVKKVGVNKRAIVEIGTSNWCWSTEALKLLAKSEEMIRIILQKKQQEEDDD